MEKRHRITSVAAMGDIRLNCDLTGVIKLDTNTCNCLILRSHGQPVQCQFNSPAMELAKDQLGNVQEVK